MARSLISTRIPPRPPCNASTFWKITTRANEAGSLYLRRQADARLADGSSVRVWVYFWNGAEIGQPVAGGDFSRREKRQG